MPGFDGECWAPIGQKLFFGCAVIGRTRDWHIDREVIFYPDDLPASGVAALRQYVAERTLQCGASPQNYGDGAPYLIWRDEARLGAAINGRSVKVQLLPLSQFLKLLYRIAYEDRALVIGYNLPFGLARLAWAWYEIKKGRNVGGWKLVLWTFLDPKTGKQRPNAFRPCIILKRVAPTATIIGFTGRRGSRYSGEFLDLSNFGHGLTGRHWTLAEALTVFTGQVINKVIEDGRISAEHIGYCRRAVHATVALAEALISLFDRLHPISRGRVGGFLSETRIYSPGGLARAYLKAAGFSPPAIPTDRLGACCAANFGGWAEVQVRGRMPDAHVDYRRQYQMIFVLQGLQDLLAAERLDFVEDTEAVREFVANLTPGDVLHPETHPKLNVLCWVKPNGAILPVRAAFRERTASGVDHFTLAIAPRYSDQLLPFWLADVVAAKLHDPKGQVVPEIVRAERVIPVGRQCLRKTRLFGGALFDPRKDQIPKVLVEEAERFNRGYGRYADIPEPVRTAILPGVKAMGNIMAYGALAETRAADLLTGRREEVTLLTDTEPVRAALTHPEDPGAFACPPIAGLVAAGGRLLLAMVHHLVRERGGIVAAGDTDGAHMVASEHGGTVHVETRGANYHEGGQAQPVHALSYRDVEEIAALFEPLNPFDRTLMPGSPLRAKGASQGLFISAKRYELSDSDGNFIDRKESILGMLMPPFAGWIDDGWRTIGEIWDGRLPTPRPWLSFPAVRQIAATSPAHAQQIKGCPNLRPFNFFLVATVIGRNPREVNQTSEMIVAPFERDPEKWVLIDWRFVQSGEPVQFDRPDSAGVRWRVRTLRDFLTTYARHAIAEMLAPDGSRCGSFTRGVLHRRPVRDGERWLLLKEAAVWGDDPNHAFSAPEPEKVRANARPVSGDWEQKIRPALAVVGPTAVARRMRLSDRSTRAWTAGRRHPENPGEVARAIVAAAQGVGLGLPGDEHHRAEGICADLAHRAAAVQCFIVIVTAVLAERYGGVRALARAMEKPGGADLEPTLRRWLALDRRGPRPIAELNPILARLSKFSRAEIRKARRRIRTEAGPAGDRQAVLAHISLLYGAEKPVVPTPGETIAFPAVILVVALLVTLVRLIAQGTRTSEVHGQSRRSVDIAEPSIL